MSRQMPKNTSQKVSEFPRNLGFSNGKPKARARKTALIAGITGFAEGTWPMTPVAENAQASRVVSTAEIPRVTSAERNLLGKR